MPGFSLSSVSFFFTCIVLYSGLVGLVCFQPMADLFLFLKTNVPQRGCNQLMLCMELFLRHGG